MDSLDMMGENMGTMLLQGVVVLLAIVIVFMIYTEKSKTSELQKKLDTFKCPECPTVPECPDCNCSDGMECPACVCDNQPAAECPACPECPKATSGISKKDINKIVSAIFPDRNPGMTSHGKYFSFDDLNKNQLKKGVSDMDDLTYGTFGSGMPARVDFSKSNRRTRNRRRSSNNQNTDDSVVLASQVDPPINSGFGLFSEPSEVNPPAQTPPAQASDDGDDASN